MKVLLHYAIAAALTVVALRADKIGEWVDDQYVTAEERHAALVASWPKCPKLYRVASEVAIFGCIVGRDGFDVKFQPCYGPPVTIASAKLEPTDWGCDDAPTPGA